MSAKRTSVTVPLLLLALAWTVVGASAEEAPPCRQPVLDRLRFLDGAWDVRARTRLSGNPQDWEESRGTAVFERRVQDCAVLERYRGTRRAKPFEMLRLFTGAPEGKGLRVSVSDSEHGPLYTYEGAPGDSGLVFTLPLAIPSGPVLLRLRFAAITPDSFNATSERSTDQGKTWDRTGHAEYRRATNAPQR